MILLNKYKRNKFYKNIEYGSIESDNSFLIKNKKNEYLIRTLYGNQYNRIRFFHNYGYVAKGYFNKNPCITRVSQVKLLNIYIIGMGIRYWTEGSPNDLVLLYIYKSDNIFDKTNNIIFKNIINFENKKTFIDNFLYSYLILNFLQSGKNPLIIKNNLDNDPYKLIEIISNQKTFEDIVKQKEQTMSIYSDKKYIGDLKLYEFNQDPNFGANLRFKHDYIDTEKNIPFYFILPYSIYLAIIKKNLTYDSF